MEEQIRRAAELIRAGRLVAFPTETVYGLGANALDARAVRRIFEVKGRPPTIPLIVHVKSIEMARQIAVRWPAQAEILAQRYWPGPLTLVVPKHPKIPGVVTAGLDSVGIRMPAHPIAHDLICAAGVPIAAPSANKFARLSPTTAEHVRESFTEDEVPLVLDGGPTEIGIESTVVSVVGDVPVLLRPGMIHIDNIARIDAPQNGPHPSPGMHERHYSPRTPVLLVRPGDPLPPGHGTYVWWSTPALAANSVRMPADHRQYAAALYSMLHDLDSGAWEWIAVEQVPDTPEWMGIRDRLERASR